MIKNAAICSPKFLQVQGSDTTMLITDILLATKKRHRDLGVSFKNKGS